MINRFNALTRGLAELFFLPGPIHGAVLLAILLINPRITLFGLIATLSAYAAARVIGNEATLLQSGYLIYNPFLVGCSIGFRFQFAASTIVLTMLAGVAALVVTLLLAQWMVVRLRLPLLSLPFSLTAAAFFALATRYGQSFPAASGETTWGNLDLGLPLAVETFFRAMGSIVFAPSVIVGLLLSLLILVHSRIALLMAIGGFAVGVTSRGLLLGSIEQALFEPSNFNYILIAMALGGVFLVPSPGGVLTALLAVAITPLVLDGFAVAWNPLGVPAFTLPFCLVAAGGVYALRLSQFRWLHTDVGRSPEEICENVLVARKRFPGDWRTLQLPFAGKWLVWQGFNGRWTHQGIWRYAYDFVIQGSDGRMHRGEGTDLADYYCYRMPVLAPTRGRVMTVINHLADNPVGALGGGSNWGNLVIIQDPRGFFVEISHFSPQSIRVKEGDWVERGTPLGLCGNSGNSPQPHLHIQVQPTADIGVGTLPFSFVRYTSGDEFHANDSPVDGTQVESHCIDKSLDEKTGYVLDQELIYDIFRHGRPVDQLKLTVKIGPDGVFYFQTDLGRLYFVKFEGTFFVNRVEGTDPWLEQLFLTLPRMPLVYRRQMIWTDYVPTGIALDGGKRFLARLGAFLFPELARIEVRQKFVDRNQIESVATARWLGFKSRTLVEFDERIGIAAIKTSDWEIRRAILPGSQRLVPAIVRRPARVGLQAALAASLFLAITLSALAAADLVGGDDTAVQRFISQSVRAERDGGLTAAIESLTKEYDAHAQSYLLNMRLGWLQYLAGNYGPATNYYQTAVRLQPKSLEAKQGETLALLAVGKYAEAEASARGIVEIDPDNYYGQLRLAFALRMQQKYDDDARVVRHLLVAYPADFAVAAELAALTPLLPPGADVPTNGETFDDTLETAWQVSLTSEVSGKYADALRTLSASYKSNQKSYLVNARMGWLSYLTGDHAGADKYYALAIRLAPQALEAKVGRMGPLLAQSQFVQATTAGEQIVKIDKHNYAGNLWQAYALRKQGKLKVAEPLLERLLVDYPSDITVLNELGQVRVGLHQRVPARTLFLQVLALDPDNYIATQQLKSL